MEEADREVTVRIESLLRFDQVVTDVAKGRDRYAPQNRCTDLNDRLNALNLIGFAGEKQAPLQRT